MATPNVSENLNIVSNSILWGPGPSLIIHIRNKVITMPRANYFPKYSSNYIAFRITNFLANKIHVV